METKEELKSAIKNLLIENKVNGLVRTIIMGKIEVIDALAQVEVLRENLNELKNGNSTN